MIELYGKRSKLAFLIMGNQMKGVQNIHMTGTSNGWSGYLHLKDHTGNNIDPVFLADSVPEDAIDQLCFILDPGTLVNSNRFSDELLINQFNNKQIKLSNLYLYKQIKIISFFKF